MAPGLLYLHPHQCRIQECPAVGTGEKQYIPSTDFINYVQEKKIGIEFMITESACKTFNILLSEGRKVISGLIV